MKTALIVGGVVVVALVLLARGGRDVETLADDDVEGGAGTRPAGGASSGGAGVFTDGGGSSLARFKPSALAPGLAPRFGNLAALSLARQLPTAPRPAASLLTRRPRLPVPRGAASRLTGE